LVLILSKRDLATFIFCVIIAFLILFFLEIRAERRQKSISVEFSFPTVFAFKHWRGAWPKMILCVSLERTQRLEDRMKFWL